MSRDGTQADIAVIGLGLTTALGHGAAETWARLRAGASGARAIRSFSTDHMATRFAAYVEHAEFDALPATEKVVWLARRALREAFDDAGVLGDAAVTARSRLFLSTPHPEVFLQDRLAARAAALTRAAGSAPSPAPDAVVRDFFPGHIGEVLKREFGIAGIPLNVTTACASSASAIQLGVEAIRRGEIDTAVVAAADASVFPEGMLHFNLLSALSTRNEAPETASRPFTQSRDGFVMGEGGAALILQRGAIARASGRRIRGYVAGCGDATDNFHRTRSHPSGATIVASMASALADAGLAPEDVDYINAHGTSTPENDKMEALGIRTLFAQSSRRPPVSASKSMVGHTLCAAGAVEGVITLLCLEDGFLAPTINNDTLDPEIDLDVVPNQGRAAPIRTALSNSFGFGGQNVTLAFRAAGA